MENEINYNNENLLMERLGNENKDNNFILDLNEDNKTPDKNIIVKVINKYTPKKRLNSNKNYENLMNEHRTCHYC